MLTFGIRTKVPALEVDDGWPIQREIEITDSDKFIAEMHRANPSNGGAALRLQISNAENLAEALVNFLITDQGKTLPYICEPWTEKGEEAYKLYIDGFPFWFELDQRKQRLGPDLPAVFPVIKIYNHAPPIHGPIYSTEKQLNDDMKFFGERTDHSKKALEAAECFKAFIQEIA